jgi:hypothetical protein
MLINGPNIITTYSASNGEYIFEIPAGYYCEVRIASIDPFLISPLSPNEQMELLDVCPNPDTYNNEITILNYTGNIKVDSENPKWGIDTVDDEFMVSFVTEDGVFGIRYYIQGESIPDSDFSRTFTIYSNGHSLIDELEINDESLADEWDECDECGPFELINISRSGNTWAVYTSGSSNGMKLYYKGAMYQDPEFGKK